MFPHYDVPLEFFGGDSDAERRESQLAYREQVVAQELVEAFQTAAVPEAGLHLQGCAKRLMMMGRARVEIADEADTATAPVSHDRITVLNIYLNSFYLNLLGALHNIAWATTYELKLLPNVDEASSESRFFSDFGNRGFRRAIRPWPELRTASAGIMKWVRDVKRFRDPAAHRIPLSMPPGVMSEAEASQWQDLQARSWSAIFANDGDQAEALTAEANAIGQFRPWLETPRPPDGGIYNVPELMAADEGCFLGFAHRFVPALVKAAGGQRDREDAPTSEPPRRG